MDVKNSRRRNTCNDESHHTLYVKQRAKKRYDRARVQFDTAAAVDRHHIWTLRPWPCGLVDRSTLSSVGDCHCHWVAIWWGRSALLCCWLDTKQILTPIFADRAAVGSSSLRLRIGCEMSWLIFWRQTRWYVVWWWEISAANFDRFDGWIVWIWRHKRSRSMHDRMQLIISIQI